MDRSYVTVHVGADTHERIRERTDSGESVEDWVRDAIERRLDADGGGREGGGGDGGESAGGESASGGGDEESTGDDGDDYEWRENDPNYEFVDDCGV